MSRTTELEREVEELRARLTDAEDALRAIRNGEVDALVVSHPDGDRIYTLQSADLGYRLLVESMQQGAATIVGDGTLYYCNACLSRLLKTPLQRLIGVRLQQFVHPDDMPAFEALVCKAWQSSGEGEVRMTAADGTSIPVLLALNRMQMHEHDVVCILITDLTAANSARQLAALNEQLRESETRLRMIGDQIPGGAIYQHVHRPDGRVEYAYISAGIEGIFGMPAAEVMARPAVFRSLIVEEDLPRFAAAEARSERDMIPFDLEFRQRSVSGETKWVHCRSTPRRIENGSVLWDGIVVDITERKHAEEQERRRLAEILHDDLQQLLVATKIHLGLVANKAHIDPVLSGMIESTGIILDEAISKTRNLSHELSPPFFDRQDLVASMEWLCGQMRAKHNLNVRLEADRDIEIDDALASFLFRAGQELLFNIVKHANTDAAEMKVRRVDSKLEMVIADEGCGFDLAQLGTQKRAGFGLFSIQERIALMGGRLEIQSAPGQGSRFIFTAPLNSD